MLKMNLMQKTNCGAKKNRSLNMPFDTLLALQHILEGNAGRSCKHVETCQKRLGKRMAALLLHKYANRRK